ncbi:MAG: polyhydroxyalkanoate depolymerase [Planctomycetes bacterium]|nr:polyhydroxyalkanoate depolymerase [Planctomycetota bacterium]
MLYAYHDMMRRAAMPWVQALDAGRSALDHGPHTLPPLRLTAAWIGLWTDAVRHHGKPPFGLAETREEVVLERPFVTLRRFVRRSTGPANGTILLVAPMSGNHATLLRDTVDALIDHHDVVITDWRCASEVPLAEGTFGLDDFVLELERAARHIAATDGRPHVVAVCQPGVAALAATARLCAADDAARPRSLTLIGSPVDTSRNPMLPNRVAEQRPLSWFRRTLVSRVPRGRPGAGRTVYPGFLQHQAFLWMKPFYHVDKHCDHLRAAFAGDEETMRAHDDFYAEFRSVADLPGDFYLETIDRIFQRNLLARGELEVAGALVRPDAVRDAPVLVVEGERDDITGPGQTAAALDLLTGLAEADRHHHLQAGVGHYGLFSGSRWRSDVLPRLLAHFEAAATASPTG